ncbi:MAG: hypothetical protein ACJ72R_00090 [Nitrososphaeraceae archaeon]
MASNNNNNQQGDHHHHNKLFDKLYDKVSWIWDIEEYKQKIFNGYSRNTFLKTYHLEAFAVSPMHPVE